MKFVLYFLFVAELCITTASFGAILGYRHVNHIRPSDEDLLAVLGNSLLVEDIVGANGILMTPKETTSDTICSHLDDVRDERVERICPAGLLKHCNPKLVEYSSVRIYKVNSDIEIVCSSDGESTSRSSDLQVRNFIKKLSQTQIMTSTNLTFLESGIQDVDKFCFWQKNLTADEYVQHAKVALATLKSKATNAVAILPPCNITDYFKSHSKECHALLHQLSFDPRLETSSEGVVEPPNLTEQYHRALNSGFASRKFNMNQFTVVQQPLPLTERRKSKMVISTTTTTATSTFRSRSLLSVDDFQTLTEKSNHTSDEDYKGDILAVPGFITIAVCVLIVTGGMILFACKTHSFLQSQRAGESEERDFMVANQVNYS